ncbi:MAG: DUF4230 domain-containing protein [Oscillospiraceae bacterium]|nr:DUF4230 domain-containing protein [Oscillospiraceae bacterium]
MSKKLAILLIALLLIGSVGLFLWSRTLNDSPEVEIAQTALPEKAEEKPQRPSIIKVEEKIKVETLVNGLRDVGKLVSEEYFFTEIVQYSNVKSLWKVTLPWTKSAFLISYDGVVSAGMDLSAVTVQVDEETKTIRVLTPAAEILAVDIDYDSFLCYSEETGIGNPISIESFNDALQSVEKTAAEKALEKGILDRARENGEQLIRTILRHLVDLGEYTLVIEQNRG